MMLRAVFGATRLFSRLNAAPIIQNVAAKSLINELNTRNFMSITSPTISCTSSSLLKDPKLIQIANTTFTRNVIKYSMLNGKRKSVKPVLRRFYRLNWGAWIRTKAGRQKKLWKKSSARKRRLRQHVFCNSTQSLLLDKMAGKYWRKPKYFVDDPYAPYHEREEFPLSARKPKPYFPPEQ